MIYSYLSICSSNYMYIVCPHICCRHLKADYPVYIFINTIAAGQTTSVIAAPQLNISMPGRNCIRVHKPINNDKSLYTTRTEPYTVHKQLNKGSNADLARHILARSYS